MEKNAMNTGALTGLEQVHLTARARKQVERQVRFAAMIVDMVIGKAASKSTAKKASAAH